MWHTKVSVCMDMLKKVIEAFKYPGSPQVNRAEQAQKFRDVQAEVIVGHDRSFFIELHIAFEIAFVVVYIFVDGVLVHLSTIRYL